MIKPIGYTTLEAMIDICKTTVPDYLINDDYDRCEKCGRVIARGDYHYNLGGDLYCEECDWKVKGIVDEALTDLLGVHVEDDILNAIVDSAVKGMD